MKEIILLILSLFIVPCITYMSIAINQYDDREKPDDAEQEEWINKWRKIK